MTKYGGTVAACGLARGMDLPTSVAPFILRGVTLAGVDSVMAPKPARVEAWARLARDLDRGQARGHDGDAARCRRGGAGAGYPCRQGARARGAEPDKEGGRIRSLTSPIRMRRPAEV